MITLYEASETQFTKNGLGSLPDALSCTVTEERNGQYELEMSYPRTGRHWDDLKRQRIIYAKPTPYSDPQPFPIYKITKDIKGTSKIYAEHISYRLSKIPVSPFTATTCAQALAALKTNAAEDCPFNFSTDKQVSSNFEITVPKSIRQVLGGSDDSILEKYKGEYEFDKFNVKLWTNRGADRGVKIRYGKNMTDFEQEESIENTYTGIYPYWTGTVGDGIPLTITLPEKVLYSSNASLYAHRMTIPVDLTSRFSDLDGPPTEAQLRAEALEYISANNIGVPKVSMDVSFVALRQTQEYQNVAPLERVHLCDTVTVEFEKLNVEATAKVVKTVYNVLTDRYDSITVGDAKSNLAGTITNQNGEIKKATEDITTDYQRKIIEATNALKGAYGGHVVMGTDADGHPNEIFIMDTDDISTAINIIRMNYQGIGYSTQGIEGPYNSAWLIDGTFDASKINVINLDAGSISSGYLSADRIESGTVDSSKLASSIQTSIANGVSAYNRKNASEGTCSTAAGTAAKVVTSSGFSLASGRVITVYFSTANTVAGAITLNVNSTGAKTVYVASAATSSSNMLKWNAGMSLSFMYNGTGWVLIDLPCRYYSGACSTAAATAAKTATVNGGLMALFKGVSVSVPMTNANTSTSATFNVNSLGAANIYYGTTTTRPTTANGHGWLAGRTALLEFDGAYWRLQEVATIIDAGFIQTGTMVADRIYGGTLTLGGANNANGQLVIKDASSNTVGTWNNNGIQLLKGTVGGWAISDSAITSSTNGVELRGVSSPGLTASTATSKITVGMGGSGPLISLGTKETSASSYSTVGSLSASKSVQFALNCVYFKTSTLFEWSRGSTTILLYNGTSSAISGSNYPAYTITIPTNIKFGSQCSITSSGTVVELPANTTALYMNVTNNLTVGKKTTTVDMVASGYKSRRVSTNDYSDRLLYCYETPSPMFGDIGEGEIGEDGLCHIWIDPVFIKTISSDSYQVFLQKYGEGDVYIYERKKDHFVVKGSPNLKFGWEIKAKQAGFEDYRLEREETLYDVPQSKDYGELAMNYISELHERRMT